MPVDIQSRTRIVPWTFVLLPSPLPIECSPVQQSAWHRHNPRHNLRLALNRCKLSSYASSSSSSSSSSGAAPFCLPGKFLSTSANGVRGSQGNLMTSFRGAFFSTRRHTSGSAVSSFSLCEDDDEVNSHRRDHPPDPQSPHPHLPLSRYSPPFSPSS